MFKKVITIVIPIIAVIAAIFVFGFKVYEDSFDKFQYDGYVIGNIEGKENTKYYFTKDNKYKVNASKNEVEFSNTDDEEIIVPDASFVHYADGSISTFKKAVVFNLENVKTDTIQFYNVYNGSVFTKTSNGHQIKNVDKKIEFNNFIVKVSDTKYMVVGEKLTIKYADEEKIIKNGYLEINYLDGNIVRIDNQDLTLQNISSDFHIETSEIKVDLLDKKIIYKDETKLNFGEITIDSDDNIEIIPDDENTKIDEEASNKIEEFENQPVVSPGVDIGGMESGIVDTSLKKPDEIVQENAKIPDAVFTVQSLSVSANNVAAQVHFTDNENTLTGGLNWKVVENATNTIMCMQDESTNSDSFAISCGNLAPGTNYSIIVRAPYEKNEIPYEKDFVQKTFVTDSTGILIEKDYVTSSVVSYKVTVNEHSEVTKYDYRLVDENNQTVYGSSGTINLEDPNVSREQILEFSSVSFDIHSNSKYSLVISNVVSSGYTVDGYETYKILKTLKQKPVYGSTSIQTNKLSSSFQIYLNNISDPDNGILNYRADVYDESEPNKVIVRREANASSELKIEVDGNVINRRTSYIAKLYVTFYDNEKEYDLYIGQQQMKMASEVAPQVEFEITTARHDYLESTFTISDPKETIRLDKPIKIILRNSSIGVEASKTQEIAASPYDPTKFSFTVKHDNLKMLETYMYIIKATVDLDDGAGEREMEIGQFVATTPETRPLSGEWVNSTKDHIDDAFYVTMQLFAQTSDLDKEHEVKTMESLKLRLSSTDFNPAADTCSWANRCWEKELVDTIAGSSSSDFLEKFYNQPMVITKDLFNADRKYITFGEYKIEIINTGDYTNFKNKYKFTENTTSVIFMANPHEESLVSDDKFEEGVVYNDSVDQYDTYPKQILDRVGRSTFYNSDLNDNTIVGYTITPKIEYDMSKVDITGWYVYDLREEDKFYEIPEECILDETGTNTYVFLFDQINNCENKPSGFKFERGIPYGMSYGFEIHDDQGTPETTDDFNTTVDKSKSMKTLKTQPEKQVPTIESYLSKTVQNAGTNTYIFKIFYNDPDSAVVDYGTDYGKTLKYTNSGSVDWQYVSCGTSYNEKKDCITKDTIAIQINTANLMVKMEYQTLQKSASRYAIDKKENSSLMLDGMSLFQPAAFPDVVPEYEISQGSNNVTYRFKSYSSEFLSKRVANVRLTLIAYNKGTGAEVNRTVLYKNFEENGYATGAAIPLINVDYSEIPGLMGDYNIVTTVELLYDTNVYGFDIENDNNGQAVQLYTDGQLSYGKFTLKNYIVNVENFDYEEGILKVKNLSSGSATEPISVELKKGGKGLYYEKSGKTTIVNVKKLSSKTIACNNGDYTVCQFTFDSIQPTFILQENDIRKSIGLLEYTPNITIDDSVGGFVLRRYYYDTTIVDGSPICSDRVIEYKDYTRYDLEASNFKILDAHLAVDKTYCIKFKYYDTSKGKINNSTGKTTTTSHIEGETEGYELRDMFYGAAYHNTNTDPQRKYFAKTKSKPTFTTETINYDTGTVQSTDPAYGAATTEEKQHDVYNRSLNVNFEVDTLENYSGFEFQIWTYNEETHAGSVWDAGTASGVQLYPIEDIVLGSQKSFEFKINLDKIIGYYRLEPSKNYYLYAFPYKSCTYNEDPALNETLVGDNNTYTCKEDGKMLLEPEPKRFSFSIISPTVTIQRIQPTSNVDRTFALKITVDDRYRAVGGYSNATNGGNPSAAKYVVTALTNKGEVDIRTFELTKAIDFVTIDNIDACQDVTITTCQIIVKYNAELTNNVDGYADASTALQETKNISIAQAVDMGTVNISNISLNSITVTFTGTYNINTVKFMDYSISLASGGAPQAATDVSVTWDPMGDEVANRVIINRLNIQQKKDYNVTLSFKDEYGIVVATVKFNGISRQ